MDYTLTGDRYLSVRFSDIDEFLGREHQGSGDDDRKIIDALLASGAPEWVAENEGFIDNDGSTAWWCIKGPGYKS